MTFQVSDYNKKNFLDLVNDNNLPIIPTYIKGSLWLNHLGHSNSLYI